ncbi:hypothetical protein NFI96_000331 [Prochilodus magdalenae]|nr:hypothetical protein NFI96_000331 [Prochilodus magdalenae]
MDLSSAARSSISLLRLLSHVTSSPQYPQSNGPIKNGVEIVKLLMKKAMGLKTDPYLALLNYRKGASDGHTLNEDDITAAEEMVKLLGPLKAATTVMSEEQPTVIASLKAKLLHHFRAADEDCTMITDMKHTMTRELEQWYVDVQQVLHKASALDTRFPFG